VRLASPADRDRAVATLIAAFAVDSVMRWIIPDDATYPAKAAAFFSFMFDARVAVDGAWVTDGVEAVALWSPPRDAAPEWEERAWERVAAVMAPDEIDRCDRWNAAIAPLHPTTPHWTLGLLATAPQHQGGGFGPAVARPGIEAADAAGLAAVLDTGVERNVALYERMGFVVTAIVDEPDVPKAWFMRRDPSSERGHAPSWPSRPRSSRQAQCLRSELDDAVDHEGDPEHR
jgi:GNAT superfamily N-acetyltransferase